VEDFIAWPIWIAIYLFFGGVSAGSFAVAAFSDLYGGEKYRHFARIAAYSAPVPIILGLLLLIFDLGMPFTFWRLLVYPNFSSVMSLGVFLLGIYTPVCIVYAYLLASQKNKPYKKPEGLQKFLAWGGIALANLVAIYTALLLQQAAVNVIWATSILPVLFVVSGFSTGIALTTLVACYTAPEDSHEAITTWSKCDFFLNGSKLIVVALMIMAWAWAPGGEVAMQNVVLGGYAVTFWVGFVLLGLVAPFRIAWIEMEGRGTIQLTVIAAVCSLLGGYLLRHVILFAGQMA